MDKNDDHDQNHDDILEISGCGVRGCKTVAHKKPQASNKEDPSCPIKMMTIKMMTIKLAMMISGIINAILDRIGIGFFISKT